MRMRSAAALAAAAILLAGCAGPPATTGPAGSSPSPGAGESADATSAPAATVPIPLLDLSCAELADRASLDAAFGPAIVEIPLTFEGSGGYYPLSQLGLAQAGALRCEFSDGGDSDERYALLSVLPEAAAAWDLLLPEIALFQPQVPAIGDDARQSCRTDSYIACRIDVRVGDRWLSAVLGGLTSPEAGIALVEAATAAIAAAAPADPAWTTMSTAPASCETLLPATTIETAIGMPLQPWERAAPTQPVLYHAGFVAAGGLFCGWRNDFGAASAMTVDAAVLPGGAWAWADYWARPASPRIVREPVAGLGDEAWAGCTGDANCWASVRVGEDWLDVTVNDESSPDETAVAIELARAIVEAQ